MPNSLNSVTLIGELLEQPDFQTYQFGGKAIRLKVVTDVGRVDDERGVHQINRRVHVVTVHKQSLITAVERDLCKGVTLLVQGELRYRKWKNIRGLSKFSCEIAVDKPRGKLLIYKTRAGKSLHAEFAMETDMNDDEVAGIEHPFDTCHGAVVPRAFVDENTQF